jgi:glycosyltransferase involved in cell wall biosynthesis
LGVLGFWVAHDLHVPLVASWHTNLHQYLARRLDGSFSFLPHGLRDRITGMAEQQSFRACTAFYGLARCTMAPNRDMIGQIERRTGRPSFHMEHGVDLTRFAPQCSASPKPRFRIGYVGRLTLEKNVRYFAELERRLIAAGRTDFEFLMVGEGGQREWLKKSLHNVELPGILRDKELASAFKSMDVFVFPSTTDTFGLVLLEALASGVPVIASPEAGARAGVEDGIHGFLSEDFASSVLELMENRALRDSMGLAARRLACTKGWDGVFEALYSTYESCMEYHWSVVGNPALHPALKTPNK